MAIAPGKLKAFAHSSRGKPPVKFAKNADGKPVPLVNGKRNDLPAKDTPEDKAALATIQREAKKWGSELASGGKGGLPSTLVLRVFRRDKYRCKTCGQRGNIAQNGGLSVHHKGGIVESEWLSNKGHANEENNLVSICVDCHDKEHEKAKKGGYDASQVTPKGDEGDPRRDKGLPPAHPPK
jgi:5-methylcytosine-specific restriction endonuclease McrA